MADERKLALAHKVFAGLCDALDAREWHYDKDEEKLAVHFGVKGDDIPIKIAMFVDVERQLIRLLSPLPFSMSEDKRIEGAVATCEFTDRLADGSFDFDISTGEIFFRMTASFRESVIGEKLFQYMISRACQTVDDYNDTLLALNKGVIDINKILASRE